MRSHRHQVLRGRIGHDVHGVPGLRRAPRPARAPAPASRAGSGTDRPPRPRCDRSRARSCEVSRVAPGAAAGRLLRPAVVGRLGGGARRSGVGAARRPSATQDSGRPSQSLGHGHAAQRQDRRRHVGDLRTVHAARRHRRAGAARTARRGGGCRSCRRSLPPPASRHRAARTRRAVLPLARQADVRVAAGRLEIEDEIGRQSRRTGPR